MCSRGPIQSPTLAVYYARGAQSSPQRMCSRGQVQLRKLPVEHENPHVGFAVGCWEMGQDPSFPNNQQSKRHKIETKYS